MSITLVNNESEEISSTIAAIKSIEESPLCEIDGKEEEDADYDPVADTKQFELDEEENIAHEEEMDKDAQEDSDGDIAETQEDEFETQLNEALTSVRGIAKYDRSVILEKAREQYKIDTGKEPTDEMMAAAFSIFQVTSEIEKEVTSEIAGDSNSNEIDENDEEKIEIDNDEEINEEEQAEFEKEFQREFYEAIAVVRELGQKHAEQLVDSVCNTFYEINGKEATFEELKGVFGRIKIKFADEAQEEFLERNDEDSDEENDDTSYVQCAFADVASQKDSLPTILVSSAKSVVLENLKKSAVKQFNEEQGRNPNNDELKEIIEKISKIKFSELPFGDDNDDDDEDDSDYVPNEDDAEVDEEDEYDDDDIEDGDEEQNNDE